MSADSGECRGEGRRGREGKKEGRRKEEVSHNPLNLTGPQSKSPFSLCLLPNHDNISPST